jgi:hypothetical protein
MTRWTTVGPLQGRFVCVGAMESVSVHSYRVGQWLVKLAPEGEHSMNADSRQLDAGGVSETLAALTLAQARASASATGTMRPEQAAAAVEDIVCGSSPSAELPIEIAVKQAAGDLSREEPPVSAVAVASQTEAKKTDSALAQDAVEEVLVSDAPSKAASELASAAEAHPEFYDAQSEVLPTETKGEPSSDEAGAGGISAVVNAVASAAERAAAAIGLVSKGE